MMEIALLENLQREDLNAMEEAKAYQSLIDHLHITQEEVSKRVGKSRSHITNMLGLLRLPKEVQTMINDKKLTMGHARVLSKLENEQQIIQMAEDIVENKKSVREAETLAQDKDVEHKVKMNRRKPTSSEYRYVEELLRDKLDTRVRIKEKKIEINFTNKADLNRILEILQVKE